MDIIGLTGGTGSGKSVVSKELEKRNSFIIDCDKIAHRIILKGESAYDEIVGYFGEDILDKNGEITRKKLGQIVFLDKEKLKVLNKCTHKHIYNEVIKNIDECKKKGAFDRIIIDAPLLIEGGLTDLCDTVWVVYCDEDTRAERIVLRDNILPELAKRRIQSQKSFEEYKKVADVIIDNSGDLDSLKKQIDNILNSNER